MNGYINAQIVTGGTIDEMTGIPIPDTVSWGKDVECKYFANTLNNRGRYQDGKFQQSAYEITTDDMTFRAKIIRLKNSRKEVIVEKEVQSLEELEDIQRVKITV